MHATDTQAPSCRQTHINKRFTDRRNIVAHINLGVAESGVQRRQLPVAVRRVHHIAINQHQCPHSSSTQRLCTPSHLKQSVLASLAQLHRKHHAWSRMHEWGPHAPAHHEPTPPIPTTVTVLRPSWLIAGVPMMSSLRCSHGGVDSCSPPSSLGEHLQAAGDV